jgi:hypothetical protein
MVPMLHGPWRTHKVASPVTSHTEATAGARRRRTDQSLAPTLLADEGAPQALPGNRYSTLPLLRLLSRSPAAVNVARGPQGAPGLRTCTKRTASQRSSNRLEPSHGCCCRKEHRKKVRLIRPRQSQAKAGNQRNYSELPYVGVQSVLSPLP